jgi:hypothetical protein
MKQETRAYFPLKFTQEQLHKKMAKCPVCGYETEQKDDDMGTLHVWCKKCVFHAEVDYEYKPQRLDLTPTEKKQLEKNRKAKHG